MLQPPAPPRSGSGGQQIQQTMGKLLFFAFFPNRGRRPIRVLILVQREGYTETQTKREAARYVSARRPQLLFRFLP